MAEKAKRRIAAARLAVAFAAAGTIAGATAWAQADAPAVDSYAKGEHIKKATLQLRSDSIVNGSLLFEDFKKGEVPPFKVFQKVEIAFKKHKSEVTKDISTIKGEISTIKGEVSSIKGELGSYIKSSDADARYIKVTDDVVRGDGEVFSATAQGGVQKVRMLDVPGMFTVDAEGPTIRITNTSGSELQHSTCGAGTPSGTIAVGGHLDCPAPAGGAPATVQVIGAGAGGGPHVSTLTFTQIDIQGSITNTVQILIGL